MEKEDLEKLINTKMKELSCRSRNNFKNWLRKNDLLSYCEVVSEKEAIKLYRKLIDTFVDFSFIDELKEVYGEEELKKLSIEELVGEPSDRFNDKLITLSEMHWISGNAFENEKKHRERVKEIILNKKNLKEKKIYLHMGYEGNICILDYENLEKFIDKAKADNEYYIFDDSFTWCLSVNHEYCIIVCGDLMDKS